MEKERNNYKRPCTGSDDEERTTRPRVDEGDDRTVTEEEVEEFYAILRRMHEASRGFVFRSGDRGGVRGGRRGGAAGWVPAFKLEDFEEVEAVKVNGSETPTNEAETIGGEVRRPSAVAEDDDGIPGCLDLNTEPNSQGLAHGKPERGSGRNSTALLSDF